MLSIPNCYYSNNVSEYRDDLEKDGKRVEDNKAMLGLIKKNLAFCFVVSIVYAIFAKNLVTNIFANG